MKKVVRDEQEMLALGSRLAQARDGAAVFYLHGQLGTGKTTLVRGFLRGMGYAGPVKSPTFTLIEPYVTGSWHLYHLDLYRVRDAEELAYLGLRELQDADAIILVEWPEQGAGFLPPADVVIEIEYALSGRGITLKPLTPRGEEIVSKL